MKFARLTFESERDGNAMVRAGIEIGFAGELLVLEAGQHQPEPGNGRSQSKLSASRNASAVASGPPPMPKFGP